MTTSANTYRPSKKYSVPERQPRQGGFLSPIYSAANKILRSPPFLLLAISSALNMLALYYFILLKTTTLSIFWQSNTPFYNIVSLSLSLANAISFGLLVSLAAWNIQKRISRASTSGTIGNGICGAFLGALGIGCPSCGAFLISLFGVGGSLTAFPLQGIEIQAIALGLLVLALRQQSRLMLTPLCSTCAAPPSPGIVRFTSEGIVFNLTKENAQHTLRNLAPLSLGIAALVLIALLPYLSSKLGIGLTFQRKKVLSASSTQEIATPLPNAVLLEEINPAAGYTINATYGDLGPRLVKAGIIDLEKFKKVYRQANQPLTAEQIKILTTGSTQNITIREDNAYFLLNFLWALGLGNKNPILEKGPLMQYGGRAKIGFFASTGGWTLGAKPATELYASEEIIKLTPEQQKELERFAYNSYRPCCNNSTAFADCNHGMAALALGEILAAQGAKAEEMFEALKYFNAFWFPRQYLELATYFRTQAGKSWKEIPAALLLSKDFSTASGWSRIHNRLASLNLLPAPKGQGNSGCGV
jgi:hypothetical protein